MQTRLCRTRTESLAAPSPRAGSRRCHGHYRLYSRWAHPTVGQPARQAQSAYATHPRVAALIAPSSADTTRITAPTCCQRVSVSQKYLTEGIKITERVANVQEDITHDGPLE